MHKFSHVHLKRKQQFQDNQVIKSKSAIKIRIKSTDHKNIKILKNAYSSKHIKNSDFQQQIANLKSLKSSSQQEVPNKPTSELNDLNEFNFSVFSSIVKNQSKKLLANDAVKLKEHLFKDYLKQVKKFAKGFQQKKQEKVQNLQCPSQALQINRFSQDQRKINSIRSSKSIHQPQVLKVYKSASELNQDQLFKHSNRRKISSSVDYRKQSKELQSQKLVKPSSNSDCRKVNLLVNFQRNQLKDRQRAVFDRLYNKNNSALKNDQQNILEKPNNLLTNIRSSSCIQPSYYYSDKNQLMSLKQFLILFTESKKREQAEKRKILRKKDQQIVEIVEKRIQTTSSGRQQKLRLTSSYAKKMMSRQKNRNEQQQEQDLLQMIKRIQ